MCLGLVAIRRISVTSEPWMSALASTIATPLADVSVKLSELSVGLSGKAEVNEWTHNPIQGKGGVGKNS